MVRPPLPWTWAARASTRPKAVDTLRLPSPLVVAARDARPVAVRVAAPVHQARTSHAATRAGAATGAVSTETLFAFRYDTTLAELHTRATRQTSALPTICNRRPFFLVVAFMATTSFEPSTSDGTGFIL